ncbi:hypothetical protein RhiirC2_65953 [Rhizophagus irregularis]|uniref:Uncharacterized protein n=1 Tax=Rhizophagus irregularis TaxID=588596 RepID=A0A2N1NUC8_9GLOM|nr:hypothetical protein RhiirC2_65953 [Rhizophagus irregularis]
MFCKPHFFRMISFTFFLYYFLKYLYRYNKPLIKKSLFYYLIIYPERFILLFTYSLIL